MNNIEGWMTKGELRWLRESFAPDQTVVELGTHKGRSCIEMAGVAKKVYAVDHWKSLDVYMEFMNNAAPFLPDKIFPIKGDTVASAVLFEIGSVDRIFIDADHTNAMKDIAAWWPRLNHDTGIMAGHDYSEHWPQVVIDVNDFARELHLEVQRGKGSIWYLDPTVYAK